MKKVVATFAAISLTSAPALSQVRPNQCVPVFPVLDEVAALPQDVLAEPLVPVAARRSFFGLPFLLPLLAALGGIAAGLAIDDDDEGSVSPA